MSALDMVLHFDGGCWPNPGGDPRYGWHLDMIDGWRRVADGRGEVPGLPVAERTNNTAEFLGLRAGLLWLASFRLAPVERLTVHGDSQLVVNVFNGTWKAKKPHLKELARDCRRIADALAVGHLEVKWTPRKDNAEADRLAGVELPARATR